ncbi:histidine phosphatase family protein [Roseobacteraceae bacterium S113]
MALTFLRHTQPDVAKGICYGRTDLSLAASAPDDIAAAVAPLTKAQQIFTSPLKRCRQLADAIGKNTVLDGVVEMDFGAWEMTPWDAINRAELDAWAADFLHARPHGGESVAQLRDRVDAALAAIPDGALVVTHHGVIKAAAALRGHPEGWDINVAFGTTLTL